MDATLDVCFETYQVAHGEDAFSVRKHLCAQELIACHHCGWPSRASRFRVETIE